MVSLNTHPEVASRRERALQIAHELCDVLKVREIGGNNSGPQVEEMLKNAGLTKGDAWCAAQVYFCLTTAGVDRKKLPSHPGSVIGFVDWAKSRLPSIVTLEPKRGDLFYWLDGSHGHIGFFVGWKTPGVFESLEGNTGDSGGRDGDGSYRKVRNAQSLRDAHQKFGFISLEQL